MTRVGYLRAAIAGLGALAGASLNPTVGNADTPHTGYMAGITGNKLLEFCNDSDPATEFSCETMITGVVSGATYATQNPNFWCMDAGVDLSQLKDIVVKDLTLHPETRNKRAAILIVDSIRAAFPCSQ